MKQIDLSRMEIRNKVNKLIETLANQQRCYVLFNTTNDNKFNEEGYKLQKEVFERIVEVTELIDIHQEKYNDLYIYNKETGKHRFKKQN